MQRFIVPLTLSYCWTASCTWCHLIQNREPRPRHYNMSFITHWDRGTMKIPVIFLACTKSVTLLSWWKLPALVLRMFVLVASLKVWLAAPWNVFITALSYPQLHRFSTVAGFCLKQFNYWQPDTISALGPSALDYKESVMFSNRLHVTQCRATKTSKSRRKHASVNGD